MKLFRELIKNYKATYKLKKRYYNITSTVGLLSVIAGVSIMMFLIFYVAPMFGFNPDSGAYESTLANILTFITIILGFILCIYLGVLLVAGIFSLSMYKLGKFTKFEALNYTLYSSYPEHWFDEKP